MNDHHRPTKDDEEEISSSRRRSAGIRHYEAEDDDGPLRSSLGSWNVRDDETFDGSSVINADEEEDFYHEDDDIAQTPTSTYKVQLSTRTTASKLDESDQTGAPQRRRRRPSFLLHSSDEKSDLPLIESTNLISPPLPVFNIDLKKIHSDPPPLPTPSQKTITQYALDSARSIKTIVIRNAWIVNGISPFLLLSCLIQLLPLLLIFRSVSQSQRSIKELRVSMSYLEAQLSESVRRIEEIATPTLINDTTNDGNRVEEFDHKPHNIPLDEPIAPLPTATPLPSNAKTSRSPFWQLNSRWSYKGRRKAPSAFFWVLRLFRYLVIPIMGPISRGVMSVIVDLAWRILLTFLQIVIVAVLLVIVACRIMCLNKFVNFLKAGCRLL